MNSDKIPFTAPGIDAVKSAVKSALLAGVNAGGLAADPVPTVDAPTAAEIDSSYKNLRELPNVTFTCKLAGAIHNVDISGTVTA